MYIKEYSTLSDLNPDELLTEGTEPTMTRLTRYFLWLTGEEVEGLTGRDKPMSWNTACTLQSMIRGFYTHNDIVFPKRFKVPKRKRSDVSKRDSRTPVFGYNEDSNESYLNGLLTQFVSNLNFRDQTVATCLLATGADASDLLNLKIEFVQDGRGKITPLPRIIWEGNRVKDGFPFRTYLSREATNLLKRYIEQERADAGHKEALFVKENGAPLTVQALRDNFRSAAERMGYARTGESNPFRPKRLRHAFREACSVAQIDQGYAEAFMGHSSGVSASYLEKGEGSFLREYIRIEPYLTLFGVDRNNVTDLAETIEELKAHVSDLEEERALYTERFTEIYDRNKTLETRIREINEEQSENKKVFGIIMMALDALTEEKKADHAKVVEVQKALEEIQAKQTI
ncbi:hypothetical protein ES703_17877 [subsurface metagenome]